ncbi:MAG: DsbA family oxidoreductase [Piscinibacter sp.]|uniref:DsbA family oxidoreductase n=1 Tax=Piscinibacter sp. TaxID=1903157 RepID=UPI002585D081|nr:DsbA family oxidoreductase [Piscinibacter sp.]MCW5667899.1 DsbA family oxidoreductase [Piscinibacter sp.]
MSRPALTLDFVSDVVCPWCAVGLSALEIALQRLAGEIDVQLHFQPFELNPQMPPEGEDIVEHLTRKYGITPEQVRRNGDALRERGAAVGFAFDLQARSRTWNSFDAHRLLHWAGTTDPAAQRALKHALLRAYHGRGENPGACEVLLRCAAEAGLDADAAAQVVDSGAFAAEVRERERHWQQLGITAVPSVVVNGQHLIQGGQPPEVFERALRQIAGLRAFA